MRLQNMFPAHIWHRQVKHAAGEDIMMQVQPTENAIANKREEGPLACLAYFISRYEILATQ